MRVVIILGALYLVSGMVSQSASGEWCIGGCEEKVQREKEITELKRRQKEARRYFPATSMECDKAMNRQAYTVTLFRCRIAKLSGYIEVSEVTCSQGICWNSGE